MSAAPDTVNPRSSLPAGGINMSISDIARSSWIQKSPNVIGGDACIRNTRIAVWMLVNAHNLGIPDEQIRERYDPPLTQADLDVAWNYYEQHRNETETACIENNED
jgi:uncharacterized protein (DUF433 family)